MHAGWPFRPQPHPNAGHFSSRPCAPSASTAARCSCVAADAMATWTHGIESQIAPTGSSVQSALFAHAAAAAAFAPI